MTKFLLVRHGVTDWIEQDLLHGISDIPLSEFGKKQAKLTAETFTGKKVDRLYSSSLARAMQTAEEISKVTSLEIEPVEGLKEMDFGWMEGKRDNWSVVKGKPIPVVFYLLTRLVSGFFSGERFCKFNHRVVNAWKKIVVDNPSGTVSVVAHSGVLRAILVHEFGGCPVYDRKFSLATCSVSEIECEEGGNMRLIEVNRNSHLAGDIY
jgi:broad specificity phosphatase PhoE